MFFPSHLAKLVNTRKFKILFAKFFFNSLDTTIGARDVLLEFVQICGTIKHIREVVNAADIIVPFLGRKMSKFVNAKLRGAAGFCEKTSIVRARGEMLLDLEKCLLGESTVGIGVESNIIFLDLFIEFTCPLSLVTLLSAPARNDTTTVAAAAIVAIVIAFTAPAQKRRDAEGTSYLKRNF